MHDSFHNNVGYLYLFAFWGLIYTVFLSYAKFSERDLSRPKAIMLIIWIIIFLLIISNASCPL